VTAVDKRHIRREVEGVWGRLHIAPSLARRGPVLLAPFLDSYELLRVALPKLSRGVVFDHLEEKGIRPADVGDVDEPLAGFLFVTPSVGLVFVNASDSVPRQRFTAAHELGHYLLHRGKMTGTAFADTDNDVELTDQQSDRHEREANRFATELLMPEEVVVGRAVAFRKAFGVCPRGALAYQLAADLLVSREAMVYRLNDPGIKARLREEGVEDE
jgi:Zn-dependent peptidase ImmA (M78 family)